MSGSMMSSTFHNQVILEFIFIFLCSYSYFHIQSFIFCMYIIRIDVNLAHFSVLLFVPITVPEANIRHESNPINLLSDNMHT